MKWVSYRVSNTEATWTRKLTYNDNIASHLLIESRASKKSLRGIESNDKSKYVTYGAILCDDEGARATYRYNQTDSLHHEHEILWTISKKQSCSIVDLSLGIAV